MLIIPPPSIVKVGVSGTIKTLNPRSVNLSFNCARALKILDKL